MIPSGAVERDTADERLARAIELAYRFPDFNLPFPSELFISDEADPTGFAFRLPNLKPRVVLGRNHFDARLASLARLLESELEEVRSILRESCSAEQRNAVVRVERSLAPEEQPPTFWVDEQQRLRELDQVAYVRFASVYRNFQDAGEFQEFVDEMAAARDRGIVAILRAIRESMPPQT